MAYELANGTVEKYQFGLVEISFMNEVTAGESFLAQRTRSRFWELQLLSQWALLSIQRIAP
jgi:hypothetical protein